MHLALAAALESEPAEQDRRAWHLGQAADSPDETVAAALERTAERATRRAGPAAAASALARAAQLTSPGPNRTRRLVAAAAASWHGGDAAGAAHRLELIEPSEAQTPPARTHIAMLRALIELRTGNPADALRLLRPVVSDALHENASTAIELLMLFGEASYHAGDAEAWRDATDAIERLALTGDEPDDVLLRLARAVGRVRTGVPPGLAHADLATVEQLADPGRLCWAGGMIWGIGDRERLRDPTTRPARTWGPARVPARSYALRSAAGNSCPSSWAGQGRSSSRPVQIGARTETSRDRRDEVRYRAGDGAAPPRPVRAAHGPGPGLRPDRRGRARETAAG